MNKSLVLLFLLFACQPGTETLVGDDFEKIEENSNQVSYQLKLNGNTLVSVRRGQAYNDAGASLTSSEGINLNHLIVVTGINQINTSNLIIDNQGYRSYKIEYNYDNLTTQREVRVYPDNIKPVLVLNGASLIEVPFGSQLNDPGATVTDNLDSGLVVSFSGSVNTSLPGDYTRTYSSKDKDNNLSNSLSRVFRVKPANNQSPIINNIADVSLKENESVVVNVVADDPENDEVILSFIDSLPSFMYFIDNGDGTGELEISPSYGDAGEYQMNLKAQDSKGASDTESFQVAIQDVLPPASGDYQLLSLGKATSASSFFSSSYVSSVVVDGVQDSTVNSSWWASASGVDQWVEVNLGQNYLISGVVLYLGKASNQDPDNTTANSDFNIEVFKNNAWLAVKTVTGNTARVREYRFSPEVEAQRIRYICRGAATFCRLREFEIYSGDFPAIPNSAPVVDAGLDDAFSLPNNETTLYGSATDQDGLIANIEWRKISGPSATLINANALTAQAKDLVQGDYIFELKVTDDKGKSSIDTVAIKVKAPYYFDPTLIPHIDCVPNSSFCKKIISPGDSLTVSATGLSGGDRVCLTPGSYSGKLRINGVLGNANAPVEFMNCGGRVIINPTSSEGIEITGASRYIKVSGTGSKAHKFGIKITKTNSGIMGMTIRGQSSDTEVEFLEIADAGFAGIAAKSDPDCSSTTRPSFVQRNTIIHDNYIHGQGGEGLYLGYSFYFGNSSKCAPTVIYPHKLEGVKVYNNYILNSGCEGIQIGSSTKDVEVYNNTVINSGMDPFADFQDNAMQIGTGTVGKWHHNLVMNAPSSGFIVIGGSYNEPSNPEQRLALPDGIEIFENIIVNQGTGLFTHQAVRGNVIYRNNTIIDTEGAAASIQNSDVQPLLKDNLMIHNGYLPAIYDSAVSQSPNNSRWGTYQKDGNKITNTKNGQGFENSAEANFVLRTDSINRANNKGAQSTAIGAPIYMTP